tara:strand:- start:1 stop:402 length:402 start_codon:yes stop_codon:yes gene_type:complete
MMTDIICQHCGSTNLDLVHIFPICKDCEYFLPEEQLVKLDKYKVCVLLPKVWQIDPFDQPIEAYNIVTTYSKTRATTVFDILKKSSHGWSKSFQVVLNDPTADLQDHRTQYKYHMKMYEEFMFEIHKEEQDDG